MTRRLPLFSACPGPQGTADLHCGLRTRAFQAAGMPVPVCVCVGGGHTPSVRSRRAKAGGMGGAKRAEVGVLQARAIT